MNEISNVPALWWARLKLVLDGILSGSSWMCFLPASRLPATGTWINGAGERENPIWWAYFSKGLVQPTNQVVSQPSPSIRATHLLDPSPTSCLQLAEAQMNQLWNPIAAWKWDFSNFVYEGGDCSLQRWCFRNFQRKTTVWMVLKPCK